MPEEQPTGTDPKGGTGTQTDDKGGNGGGTTDRTFTQDEVNAIVKQRAEKMLRQQLGDDADLSKLSDLREKASKFDELEQANQTDLEKAQRELEEAKAAASTSGAAALRLEVALEKAPDGMEPAKIAKLAKRLTGASREDLEKDADELFAEFAGTKRPPGQRPTTDLQQVPLGGDAGDVKTDMDDWMRTRGANG